MLLTVTLYGAEKIGCFAVGIKGKTLDFGVSIYHADMQLGSKFCVRMGFPTDDWPDPGLADADDTVRYRVDTVFVHVQLLFVQRCDVFNKSATFLDTFKWVF